MSKIIKLTPECIEECRKEFIEALSKAKISDGKISFNKTFGSLSRKATLNFTELAWAKMQALVREFDKEVAWHGVAHRGEDPEKDEYFVTDILVYPQEVSGTTVEMDVTKYDKWIRDNCDDERFYNIALQGHSHVRMGTTPSSVDLTHQEAILEQLTDDMFYIFIICNKSGDKNVKIYDLAKNVLFETSDVTVVVADESGVSEFVTEAKKMVTEKTYSYQNHWNKGLYHTAYQDSTPVNTPTVTKETKQEQYKEQPKNNGNKSNKRKGKRKNNKLTVIKTNACDSKQTSFYGDDFDSDSWYGCY